MAEILIDPHRLRQFLAVARYLNITRAAEELQLTQQAVSSTLKTLDQAYRRRPCAICELTIMSTTGECEDNVNI